MQEEPDALYRQSTEPIRYPMGERGQEGGRGWGRGCVAKLTERVEEREKERKREWEGGKPFAISDGPSFLGAWEASCYC